MTDNLSRKVYSGFLWVLSGRLARQALTLVIVVLLARALGSRVLEVVAMVTVFIGFTDTFMDLGLALALVQRMEALPVHFNSSFFLDMAHHPALVDRAGQVGFWRKSTRSLGTR